MSTPETVLSPFQIGAAWPAEAWPQDQWPAEIARMKETGVNCVRLFEHAWHRFEPREWEFEFDWATRLLDSLKEAGIGVIVATTTAAPPAFHAWLHDRFGQIESLNQTWGLEFGSQAFEYFEQAPTPGSACNHPS